MDNEPDMAILFVSLENELINYFTEFFIRY